MASDRGRSFTTVETEQQALTMVMQRVGHQQDRTGQSDRRMGKHVMEEMHHILMMQTLALMKRILLRKGD